MDDQDLRRRVSRRQGRTVSCPTCDASPGEQCYAKGHSKGDVLYRASNHMARVRKAARDLGLSADGTASRRSFRVQAPAVPPVPKATGPSRWEGLERATFEETRAEACPECRVEAGQPCLWLLRDGTRSPRRRDHHTARWVAAMEHLGRHPHW